MILQQMKDNSEEENLMKEIHSIVYPSYPAGCSSEQFLAHYESLFQALRKFDRSTDLNTFQELPLHKLKGLEANSQTREQQEITDHIVMMIINVLNNSCSHCHRKEYSQRIFSLIGQFQGNLKDLAIGKTPVVISYWGKLLDICNRGFDIVNPTTLYYSIKEKEVLALYDKIYQDLHYIPHRQTFLLNYTNILSAQDKFQNVLKSTQSSLPLHHQLYLAIIASATYGCKYQWSRSVAAFLKAGGDIAWIVEGSSAAPPLLQEMSKFSAMVAYNFNQLYKVQLFDGSNSNENQYRLVALIWLCYYQSLACIDLVCGFIPERIEYLQYLPDLPTVRPSIGSFEAMKQTQGMDSVHELRAAEEFANLYSWDSDNEEGIKIKIEGARSIEVSHPYEQRKRIQSSPQLFLLGRAESDEIVEKISNLQSLRYLQSVFEKYVHFQPFANNYSQRPPRLFLEDSLVLASDWDFELKGLNRIELALGSKVRQGLQNYIGALRVQNNEKSKQLKHYYEFFNNYMYEYESYTKLMTSLTINEKNYLKLVTKSPFLFTEQAFLRMKTDLSKAGIDALDFLMEAVSYKLELSINLLSFLFDKAVEECQ